LGREDAYVEYLTRTCIDITAQPIPDRLEGRSLLAATHDPQANLRDTLFGKMHKGYDTPEGPWWSGQKMAIRGKWKYIYYSRAWEGVGTEEELFDVASDPGEFTILAAEHPRCAASYGTPSWNGWQIPKRTGSIPLTTVIR